MIGFGQQRKKLSASIKVAREEVLGGTLLTKCVNATRD